METIAMPAEVQQKITHILYDPETGEFINEETMRLVEKVQSGREKLSTYASFDEFEKKLRAL